MHLPSAVARIAHDLGLAAWFGGYYMGAVALNGASREVDDPTQRARVVNAGWFRWAAVVPVAVGGHLAGAAALTRRSCDAGGATRLIGDVRAGVTLLALLATLESGRAGRAMAKAGDVPVATAVQPISTTPPEVAAAQRRLRVVQWLIPAATALIGSIDAVQREHGSGTTVAPALLCRDVPRQGRFAQRLRRR